MSLPPVIISSDPIENLSLDVLPTPLKDSFDKSDNPHFNTHDRSTSPSSDTVEPPSTKEWPFLSFEKLVTHWLKTNDPCNIVGNEQRIEQMYQDYKKDYELVPLPCTYRYIINHKENPNSKQIKPILNALVRFSVDNHEISHQMAHGMMNNCS